MKKISVGSGPNNVIGEDWINVDIRPFPGVDKVMDVTKEWPFKEVDYISGEHFLEHLTLDQALSFLIMAGNSLKCGGKIRLSTPNLTWVMLTHYDVSNESIGDTFKINRAFHGWGHKFLWSKKMLESVLLHLGYEDIRFFSYDESDDLHLTGIERHGGFSTFRNEHSVIIVQAKKGHNIIKLDKEFADNIENQYLSFVRSGH
jgi:predicted SAM-dependent methyltransferase